MTATVPVTVPVRAWPEGLALALQDLRSLAGVTVIGVATPVSADRTTARTQVRSVLRETLAQLLDQPAASITWVSRPGQAIAVESSPVPLGLSISHAPGLSVVAIGRGAALGVDLMRMEHGVDDAPDWPRVAADYLGPAVAAALHKRPASQRQTTFIQAWTRHEAGLKCLGLGLTEWSPALGQQLATCRVLTLDFTDPSLAWIATGARWVGAIALRVNKLSHTGHATDAG